MEAQLVRQRNLGTQDLRLLHSRTRETTVERPRPAQGFLLEPVRLKLTWTANAELSGRCREELEITAATRSGPLERVVRTALALECQGRDRFCERGDC